jgi:hypothetical protein
MNEAWRPVRFIDVEIQAFHDVPPALTKKPPPPDHFVWGGETYRVTDVISSWTSYERKGRMAENMAPAHAATAARRGSWGVGRFYFRVRTEGGVFDLYYDREPAAAGDRAGHWFLWREVRRISEPGS